MTDARSGPPRGRPRAGEGALRRAAALEAATQVLAEEGWRGFTVAKVAQRAQCSKESLYTWFGDRDRLVLHLIREQADVTVAALDRTLQRRRREPRSALEAWGRALLRLLTGPVSIELNRAAMANPTLAQTLRAEGRHRAGPAVESHLLDLLARGVIAGTTPHEGFGVLYGLLVQDVQIAVLLGAPAPSESWIRARAASAVEAFLRLHAPVGTEAG